MVIPFIVELNFAMSAESSKKLVKLAFWVMYRINIYLHQSITHSACQVFLFIGNTVPMKIPKEAEWYTHTFNLSAASR